MREKLLADDVAIVTGAGQGIGRAIAERFAGEGASVVVSDINSKTGAETVDRIHADGGKATFVRTDVSNHEDVKNLIDIVVDDYGGLDILVNNAGGSIDDDNLHRIDEETFEKNVNVNLKGTFFCSKEALPVIVADGGGRMVHMSSVNALTGIGLTAYSAAKGGILSLSRNIATQYGRHGIRSNALCPGTIETESRRKEMAETGDTTAHVEWLEEYALGRFGRPADVANAALYLGSDLSSFVTGTELVVDGGLTSGLNHRLEQEVYDVDEVPTRD
ncbi:SDR family NAD(P)-dependent oxidoreductase [Haladaptatus sp. GCM10025707]|uniref:SDR family NAD(P)-dependent oxidoreductase n=1 Tax=unclassified Haladaptatus TaxID=2622732 RepID=UPI0023E8AA8C|nr:SDR family NAD(P)-dependent oxidoreductase [Haladaptatus sp. QDMS2]